MNSPEGDRVADDAAPPGAADDAGTVVRTRHAVAAPPDTLHVVESVRLAPLTTLAVGGRAAAVASPMTVDELADTLRWAAATDQPVTLLGAGSNVVIADEGLDGLVVRSADYRFDVVRDGDTAQIVAGAGVEWDELVAFCVAEGLVGVEALSGIPGTVGAAPVQNIGAYGAELADVLEWVDLVRFGDGEVVRLDHAACGFGYRTSTFKRGEAPAGAIGAVALRLRTGGKGRAGYAELRAALGDREAAPPAQIRDTVLALRKRKSMVLSADDPNRRSVGSFFMNPIVAAVAVPDVTARAAAAGVNATHMPSWQAGDAVKLSAGWLVEHAGFSRGYTFGRVGISTRHALAIVNRGGARARDVVGFAGIVRRRVLDVFGVALTPEPSFLGFGATAAELLS